MAGKNRIDSNRELTKQIGESRPQINRYIRLAYLIPKILGMIDKGTIVFTVICVMMCGAGNCPAF